MRQQKFVVLYSRLVLCAIFSLLNCAHAQTTSRTWQTGTLVETEKIQVPTGTTKNTTSDGAIKNKGNKQDYSVNSTSTTTQDYDTYQNYTIDDGKKIYVVRERLFFPWSKPADTTVGDQVKFAVEKGKVYLAGGDGKEHKASVVKVSLKTAPNSTASEAAEDTPFGAENWQVSVRATFSIGFGRGTRAV
jgi:hypothetical protein